MLGIIAFSLSISIAVKFAHLTKDEDGYLTLRSRRDAEGIHNLQPIYPGIGIKIF
jgi:hypothetical protein